MASLVRVAGIICCEKDFWPGSKFISTKVNTDNYSWAWLRAPQVTHAEMTYRKSLVSYSANTPCQTGTQTRTPYLTANCQPCTTDAWWGTSPAPSATSSNGNILCVWSGNTAWDGMRPSLVYDYDSGDVDTPKHRAGWWLVVGCFP